MLPPNLYISSGAGIKAMAMNPRTLFPHPSPNAENMLGPASGKNAPNRDLDTVRAATPEAAKLGKESMT